MTWLLDGNVLVALSLDSHEFHERTMRWFDVQTESFATCATTEGTLLRLHIRFSANRKPEAAWEVLKNFHSMGSFEFWDDGFSYSEVGLAGIKGWACVTDAWLAELARRKGGRLATLDAELAARHPDVAFLIPE